MSSLYKQIIFKMICRLRFHHIVNRSLHNRSLTILTYHSVIKNRLAISDWCYIDTGSFKEQLFYLKKYFNIVSLSSGINLLKNNCIKKPTVAITFDDGFYNNYEIAFKYLQKAELPATIFLSTKYINSNDTLWFCRLIDALEATSELQIEWQGEALSLDSIENRIKASIILQSRLKRLSQGKLLKAARLLIQKLGSDPDFAIRPGSPYRMLTTDSIRIMQESGLIEFGSHTHEHSILKHLGTKKVYDEISSSKHIVERLTRKPCVLFAYPNGCIGDYSLDAIGILKKCNFLGAVTTIPGTNDRKTPLMELKRYGIGATQTFSEFQLLASNFRHFVKRIT